MKILVFIQIFILNWTLFLFIYLFIIFYIYYYFIYFIFYWTVIIYIFIIWNWIFFLTLLYLIGLYFSTNSFLVAMCTSSSVPQTREELLRRHQDLMELNNRASGEVVVRQALAELDMWEVEARFSLTPHTDSRGEPVSLIKEWKEILNKVRRDIYIKNYLYVFNLVINKHW